MFKTIDKFYLPMSKIEVYEEQISIMNSVMDIILLMSIIERLLRKKVDIWQKRGLF